jgi:Zn-dependent protease with chaperone function
MIPIPILGEQTVGQTVLTLVAAILPALIAWWNDRRLLGKGDDPALPELLASRRRLTVRAVAVAIALMIVFGGAAVAWGIPLLIALLIAAAYPLRTRVLGETWGFGAYLWHTAASIVGGFGFWIALCYAPTIVLWIVKAVGTQRLWLAALLALVVAALLLAWEAWYPRIWLWTHAGERLTSPELTPRFDEIVRRAGTVVPQVYRVGPKGSRFINAVALPSVRQPSVAMGNALLDLLDVDEAAAIFAHEVAHFDHFSVRHVRRVQLLNRALIAIGVALPLVASLTAVRWTQSIGWVWPIIVLLALGRRAAKSQQHETESDLRAAALCGDPEALVRGLVKLHAHARIPRRYDVDFERMASHPSLVRRIQAIRAGGPAAIEQLGTATVVRSSRAGSWVVLEEARSYWLDGVPDGTEPELAALRDASSSYRAVNYRDLVEIRVAADGEARTIAARTRAGDKWSVPIAPDDVSRVQRALDVVDLRLGGAGPAPARLTPKIIAVAAFTVVLLSGQAGVVLAPILVAMAKPSAAALAALGAMGVVRAIIGFLVGSSWFDQDIVRIGLVSLFLVGVFSIYTAWRLVRAGEGDAHLRLTMAVLIGVAVITGAMAVARAVGTPRMPLMGSAMLGSFATSLLGVAAALFTVRTRWSRPAAYTGLVTAALFATLGIDRRAIVLRRVLRDDSARATLESETELSTPAGQLRVSPDGRHFLALRTPTNVRPAVTPRSVLVTGQVGGPSRDLAGVDGDFIDDARMLVLNVLDRGVELRVESVDGGPPSFADTLVNVAVAEPRVTIDRDSGGWAIVGSDPDSDRTAVYAGRIGERGGALRAAVPDTIPMAGEPIVFDGGATLIVPSYDTRQRPSPLSMWPLSLSGFELPPMDMWRVHGDSVSRLGPVRGPAQCGEPSGGSAACAVHSLSGTSLYTVSARGVVAEVAQLSSSELRLVAVGPGLRMVSSSFDGGIVIIDLATKRRTRIELPPNTEFASEARAGPGWAVTLGYGQRTQKFSVRSYRIER